MAENQTQAPAPSTGPTPVAAAGEDKTVAIIAYLTLIGFIVAIILHMNKKTKLGAFHLRQTLGLWLTGFALVILQSFSSPFSPFQSSANAVFVLLYFSVFVLFVMGLVAAINGQMKPVPMVGPLYQKWFGTTFD